LFPIANHCVTSQRDCAQLIKFLEDENNPEVNDPHIRLLVNLCHCMMHVHSGFPELYGPLLQALQVFLCSFTRSNLTTAVRFKRNEALLDGSHDTNPLLF